MDRQGRIESIFGVRRALIGMLHLPALPGTPRSRDDVAAVARHAVAEARLLAEAGFHGLLMENMHDRPYLKGGVGAEIVAAMAVVGREIRAAVDLPLGVQVLAGANREALAVALACGADFVRVEGLVFGHVADEGWMEGDAGGLLRYRRAIGAYRVRIFADVKKKHAAHAATADVNVVQTAKSAEFFLADGVVLTGEATGEAAVATDVTAVAGAVGVPVLVGSGVKPQTLSAYSAADGWIVGSALKQDGVWSNRIDGARCEEFSRAYAELPPMVDQREAQ